MLSEKCVRAVFGGGLCRFEEMSTLSMRASGLQTTTMLDNKSLRLRGVTRLDGVSRNLFGCSDREENRRIVERELARQLELDSQKWGFDFANEKPLPGPQRYIWQMVPASTIPAALRRSPITITAPKPSVASQETKVSSPESAKSQKRITDFLKPRKRLANNGKKSPAHSKHECSGAHIRPPKVARMTQAHCKRSS